MDIDGIKDQNRRKVKATFFYLVLIGCVLVAGSVFVHRLIDTQVDGDRRGAWGFLESLPFVSPSRVSGIKVAVLRSGFTADYLENVSGDPGAAQKYLAMAGVWDDYLQRGGIAAEVITDKELMTRMGEFNLLVLPMAICLSDAQIDEVKRFLAGGRGVIATHAAGYRDDKGVLRGWSLASDLIGSRDFVFFPPEEGREALSFMTTADTPINAGMPPGQKIDVYTYDSPAGAGLLESRVRSAAFWEREEEESFYSRRPDSLASVAYGEYMGGRVVWTGFTMRSVADIGKSWSRFDAVIDNAISWTTRKTVVCKAHWPGGGQAAAVFGIKADYDFPGALEALLYLKSLGIEPVSFIPPAPAEINFAPVQRLAGEGCVVPFFPPGYGLQEQSQPEKERTLREVKAGLLTGLGAEIEGVAVWESGEEDITLINAAFRSLLNYVWITEGRGALPRLLVSNLPQPIFRQRSHPVFFYGNSGALERYYSSPGGDAGGLLRDMKRELDGVIKTGGVLPVIIDPGKISRGELEAVMPGLLEYMRGRGAEALSLPRAADWWRNYENIRLSAAEERPGRISFTISNTGGERAPEARVYLYPSSLPERADVRAEKIGAAIPRHEIDRARGRIMLQIEDMAGNESRTFFITF